MDVIAVGTSEFTLGFSLVGIKTQNVTSASDIRKASNEATGVIIIDEATMKGLDESDRKEFEDSIKPLFVVLSTQNNQESLSKLIKRSIGIEL